MVEGALDEEASLGNRSGPSAVDRTAFGDDISDVRWIDAPVVLIFWLLLGVVFLQFFTRYVLNDSLGWTEEAARYLLVAVGFVGVAGNARWCAHIRVEFFHRYLSRRVSWWLYRGTDVLTAGFFAVAAWLGLELAQRTAQQTMVAIPLPKALIFLVAAARLCAAALATLERVVASVREGKEWG